MISITDSMTNKSHLSHFTVQTRSFQIEKYREPEMYPTLINYIRRQNEKRKQEMEMSEELKRAKREKELKHKRDKSNLDELKQEIANFEKKKIELDSEKELLFQKFKKICKEDDDRLVQRSREHAQAQPLPPLNITFSQPNPTPPSQPPMMSQFYNIPPDRHKMLTQQQQQQLSQAMHQNNDRPVHILPPQSVNSMVPTSIHHGPPYGPPQFFPQNIGYPPHSSASGNHRMGVRLPTPTSSHKSSPSPQYSKSLPVLSHPLSSLSAQSSSGQSSPFQMANERDRQRLYNKRTHDQANPPPPPHSMPLPYLPGNFKPMAPSFSSMSSQHVLNQQAMEQFQNPQLYQFLNQYHLPPFNMNPNNNNK